MIRCHKKENPDEDDFKGALDDAMDKENVEEAKQDISVHVMKFDGLTIMKDDLDSVHTNGNWITYEILAHSLCKALSENISNSRDPGSNYDLIVIYLAVMETFFKTCKSGDIVKKP